MKHKLEYERDQEQENNALLEQFGIEIEIEKLKNENDIILLKIRFEKMRKYNNGYLELKIEKGIIHIQRCQPEVKEVERLLEQFYHHHNFMIFLFVKQPFSVRHFSTSFNEITPEMNNEIATFTDS